MPELRCPNRTGWLVMVSVGAPVVNNREIVLDTTAGRHRATGRYTEIVDQLTEAIRTGRMAPGTRLPTHRDLARTARDRLGHGHARLRQWRVQALLLGSRGAAHSSAIKAVTEGWTVAVSQWRPASPTCRSISRSPPSRPSSCVTHCDRWPPRATCNRCSPSTRPAEKPARRRKSLHICSTEGSTCRRTMSC